MSFETDARQTGDGAHTPGGMAHAVQGLWLSLPLLAALV